MTDWEHIWRLEDDIRSILNAVVSENIWHIGYNDKRKVIEIELTTHLEEYVVCDLCSQFVLPAGYDGEGFYGTKFVLYTQ